MIDFRYHIVSLISVFLALAVGIALGAGPLKESIGDTLTGQVEQLRQEKDDMRVALDVTSADLARTETVLDELAPTVLAGALGERRVAVIEVGDVDPEVLDEVGRRVGQAGGTVTANVAVAPAWTEPGRGSFRQQIAGTLLEYLDPVPPEDAGTDAELAEALVQALTRAEPTDPDATADETDLIMEVLREAELVVTDEQVTVPADAVILVTGPTVALPEAQEAAIEATADAEDPQEQADQVEALVQVAAALASSAQDRSEGVVVAGGAVIETNVVQRIRQDDDAARRLATVDGVHTVTGQVSVPLALAARIAGTVGHYGPGTGATGVVPAPVVLEPIVRVADVPEDEDGEDGDEPDPDGDEE
ncbi:copper transporter [Cellulomonas bogoriensis]|uniref:Copper transporter n=1 Tax=Cellulomonas bogoriensis 69B4 = DSM 16987 TaxID=1386082 RepID=A0A0A0BNA7_9CELL|nr:copper transporter [Cellulomonas bogoriensis]KGM09147.1 hypothetical protein N869_07990 [Cellulomonas bogoriensis 69B4 = DSM 16987]